MRNNLSNNLMRKTYSQRDVITSDLYERGDRLSRAKRDDLLESGSVT